MGFLRTSASRPHYRRSRSFPACLKAANPDEVIFLSDRKAAVAGGVPSAVLDIIAAFAARGCHEPAVDCAPVGAARAAAARLLEHGRARRCFPVPRRREEAANAAERAATAAFCQGALLAVGATQMRGAGVVAFKGIGRWRLRSRTSEESLFWCPSRRTA